MKTLIFTLLLLSTCQAQTQWHDSTITEEKLIKTCDTLENPLCNERGHVWKMYDAEEFINGITKAQSGDSRAVLHSRNNLHRAGIAGDRDAGESVLRWSDV